MGQSIDNSWTPDVHPTDNLNQTNPFANPANGVKLQGVPRYGGKYGTAFTYAITGNGSTLTLSSFTGSTPAADVRFFKFVVQDLDGNEAYAAQDLTNDTTAAADIVIDTSGLNPATRWVLRLNAEKDAGEYVDYSIVIPEGGPLQNETQAIAFPMP